MQLLDALFARRQLTGPGGYQEIWRVAWPLVIMNASNTIMLVCNRMFLSHHSISEVTAAVPAGQLFFTAMAFFLITSNFTATIISQYYGAGEKENCVRAVWNGFYFGIAVAITLGGVLPFLGSWIIESSDISPSIRHLERSYFSALTPSGGMACMEAGFLAFFTGRGKTRIVATIKIAACLVSVPLNYLMIFGRCGLPELGIVGAGYATSLASLFSLCCSVSVFLLYPQDEYRTRHFKGVQWEKIAKLLRFGAPAGLQTCIRNSAFAVVIMMIGALGDAQLAAASIAMTINMIGVMPLLGMMDATSVVTGKYIGRRKLRVAEGVGYRALLLLWIYITITALAYWFTPEILVNLFCKNQTDTIDIAEVSQMIRTILCIQAFSNFFDSIRFITMGSLRGAGDTKVPLFLGIGTSYLIQLPLCYWLIYHVKASMGLVWFCGLAFYAVIDAALLVWRKQSGAWRKIQLVKLPPVKEAEDA